MNKKGFTLIELLVVIAIIGLLSTLAVVALGSAREKARDSKRLSDLKQTQTALELYYTDNSAYPTAASSTVIGTGAFACLNSIGFAATGCLSPYMGQVPSDPGSGTYYYVSADGTTYTITATLEGIVSGLSGTVQATPSGIAGS
ncbi:prepilin-type N-terminal cleavage/methylation domain-containing protein [Patescibacteria group bacterium]|nr:prepilin-type N-terminal cleavage/methylation domain-containing protein [Patescibacteria group bacterium]